MKLLRILIFACLLVVASVASVVAAQTDDASPFPEPFNASDFPGFPEVSGFLSIEPLPYAGASANGVTASCLDAAFNPSREYDGGIIIFNDSTFVPSTILPNMVHLSLTHIYGSLIFSQDRTAGALQVDANNGWSLKAMVLPHVAYFFLNVKVAGVDHGIGWACDANTQLVRQLMATVPRFDHRRLPMMRQRILFDLEGQHLMAICAGGTAALRDLATNATKTNTRLLGGGVLLTVGNALKQVFIFGSPEGRLLVNGVEYLLSQPDPNADTLDISLGTDVVMTIPCTGDWDTDDPSAVPTTGDWGDDTPSLTVTAGSANLRLGPGTDCTVPIAVPRDTTLTPLLIVRSNGSVWYLISMRELGELGIIPPEQAADAGFAFISDQVAAIFAAQLETVEAEDWFFPGVRQSCGAGGADATNTPLPPGVSANTPQPSGGDSGGGSGGEPVKPPDGGGSTTR